MKKAKGIIWLECKESGDWSGEFGALSSYPCQAFDYIDHNLLQTKLSSYGVTAKLVNLFFLI